jgi:hypothetical protein
MKANSLAVAAAIAIVTGCAGVQTSTGGGGAAATARATSYYCAKERLNAVGDRLECNWQPTAEEACRFQNSSVLQRSAMSGDPQSGGRCSTGQWLVMVTPR